MDISEARMERFLQAIKEFRIIDDTFMKKVFEDKECTQLMLRIVMEKPDLIVKSVSTEQEIKNMQGRSVRLDVYATDSAGRQYNIEVQRDNGGAHVKRARYNSSMMDANVTEPGEDMKELPETYVIFITEHDVMRRNLPIYHIDRVIKETGEEFGDDTHIIYVNNEIQDDTPLGRLMSDFVQTEASKIHYREIAERVRYFKESEKGESRMCKVMESLVRDVAEDIRRESREEGRAEGERKGRAEGEKKGRGDLIAKLRKLGVSEEVLRQASEK